MPICTACKAPVELSEKQAEKVGISLGEMHQLTKKEFSAQDSYYYDLSSFYKCLRMVKTNKQEIEKKEKCWQAFQKSYLSDHAIDIDMKMLKAIAPLHILKVILTFEALAVSLGSKIIAPAFFAHSLKSTKDWIEFHEL